MYWMEFCISHCRELRKFHQGCVRDTRWFGRRRVLGHRHWQAESNGFKEWRQNFFSGGRSHSTRALFRTTVITRYYCWAPNLLWVKLWSLDCTHSNLENRFNLKDLDLVYRIWISHISVGNEAGVDVEGDIGGNIPTTTKPAPPSGKLCKHEVNRFQTGRCYSDSTHHSNHKWKPTVSSLAT